MAYYHPFYPSLSSSERAKRSGFTLLELSIVLVIIGLLAGGVMIGQSLVRGAEMRSIVTDFQKYKVAFQSFKTKYDAIPGDFKSGYSYWGSSCGTNATGTSGGCNGDGDNAIEVGSGEEYHVWEHLALAGMIPGLFTGNGTASIISGATQNVPISKYAGSCYELETYNNSGAGPYSLGANYIGNWIQIGSLATICNGGSITVPDTRDIDTKIDDGLSNYGEVISGGSNGGVNCVASSVYNTAAALTAKVCSPMFRLD